MLPTASKLQLAMACKASVVLPKVPHPSSASSERGTTLHAVTSALLLGKEPPKTRIKCKPDMDQLRFFLGDGPLMSEASFALDTSTGEFRFLGHGNTDRDYSNTTPSEIPGTTDIVVTDRVPLIVDVKTGKTRVPPAAENWQLRFFAACLGTVKGARGAIAYLRPDGTWEFDECSWTAEECRAFKAVLCAAWTRDNTPSPSFANCQYCECVCEDRDAMTIKDVP